jgi:transposase InsO family protein
VHDDHVRRNFTAQRPDQVWVTDITEHPTAWFLAVVATG